MGKEYDTRSFKSGNSVAIRIPAALGVEPDRDWTVTEDDNGNLVIRSKPKTKRKFNIQKVAGSAKSLRLIDDDSRLFEERSLDWPKPKS